MDNNLPEQSNPVSQPIQPPIEQKQSFLKNKWLLIGLAIILMLTLMAGSYFLGRSSKPSQIETSNNLPVSYSPTPTSAATTSPSPTNIAMKDETIRIDSNTSGILGPYTLNVGLKIPEGWTLTTSKTPEGCSKSLLTNNKGSDVYLEFPCNGWSANYSAWPADSVLIYQQNRTITSGPITRYRLRYMNRAGAYIYVDADQKNQMMDAIMVSFNPPNESTHDYYFQAARLDAQNLNKQDLPLIDRVASSIHIDSLVTK